MKNSKMFKKAALAMVVAGVLGSGSANALTLGSGADDTGVANATAIGSSATAADYATAVGNGTTAVGQSTAIGAFSSAESSLSTALGYNTHAIGGNSVAIGQQAVSEGAASVAIGNVAKATGGNSVVLGASSNDGGLSNVVSIGATGSFTRKLINMTDGDVSAASTDAINGSQLFETNTAVTAVQADADANAAAITVMQGDITNIQADVVDLQADVITAQTTANQAVTKATAAQADVDALEPVVAGHTTTINNHATRIVTLEGEMDTVQADVVDLQADVITAQTTANQAVTNAAAAQADVDALEPVVAGHTTTINNHETRIVTLEGEMDGVQADVVDLQADVITAQATADDGVARAIAAQADVDALEISAVQYDADGKGVTLHNNGGAGTVLRNVAPGMVSETSTEAINGGQLWATNQAVAGNTAAIAVNAAGIAENKHAITVLDGRVTKNEGDIYVLQNEMDAVQVDVVTAQTTANEGVSRAKTAQAGVDALKPVVAEHTQQLAQHNQRITTAQTTADKALALGSNSAQYDADGGLSLNVNADGSGSQIHNVADGTSRYDAVNLGQMQAGDAATYSKSTKYAAKGIAAAMAMPSVDIEECDEQGLNLAVGNYHGQTAVGVAYARRMGSNMTLSAGASYAGNKTLGLKVGAGWSW